MEILYESDKEAVDRILQDKENGTFHSLDDKGEFYGVFSDASNKQMVLYEQADEFSEAYLLMRDELKLYNLEDSFKLDFIIGDDGDGTYGRAVITDADKLTLSLDEIRKAYQFGIINVREASPYGGCSGVIAAVGDSEFYFAPEEYESLDAFLGDYSEDEIVSMLKETMENMTADGFASEIDMYRIAVKERLKETEPPKDKKHDDIGR